MKFRDKVRINTKFFNNIEGFVIDQKLDLISNPHSYLIHIPSCNYNVWIQKECITKVEE